MQPKRTSTALWPGIAMGIPSEVYLPRRGPDDPRDRKRRQAAHGMDSAAPPASR